MERNTQHVLRWKNEGFIGERYNKTNKEEWGTVLILEEEIYKALCFDVAQGRMNGVPSETRSYLYRFASLAG